MRQEYERQILKHSTAQSNKSKKDQTALASKYPQGFFKAKPCKVCGHEFTPNAPSELTCSEYCRAYSTTEAYYKRAYDLTIEGYLDHAEAQEYKCAICGQDNFKMAEHHSGVLVVDHCHSTCQMRGLLCHNCNRALGLFKDRPDVLQNAIHYLERATTIEKTS